MTEHTPTPWRVTDDGLWIRANNEIPAAEATTIARVDYTPRDLRKANAAFIVRAVNAHDEMLAALMVARGLVAEVTHRERGRLKLVAATLDAAIAKAEGKP